MDVAHHVMTLLLIECSQKFARADCRRPDDAVQLIIDECGAVREKTQYQDYFDRNKEEWTVGCSSDCRFL